MKNLNEIGILVFLSVAMSVMSQNPTINQMNRSIKGLNRMQQMMGIHDDPQIIDQNSVTDVDGNVYKTVKIGNQIWMAENLKVSHYRNGESIPNVTVPSEWEALSNGAYCNYNNDSIYSDKYGKLYNFFAVFDKRNIAPKGWHVATIAEWKTLTNNIAGIKTEMQGDAMTEILDGENKLGFQLMSGIRTGDGRFEGVNEINFIWSSTLYDNEKAWMWVVAQRSRLFSYTQSDWKLDGCSVRCVKDTPILKKTTLKTVKKK